jgi:hypothetical protein
VEITAERRSNRNSGFLSTIPPFGQIGNHRIASTKTVKLQLQLGMDALRFSCFFAAMMASIGFQF